MRGLEQERASRNGATEQIERGREEEPNVDRRLFTGVPQASTALPFRLMIPLTLVKKTKTLGEALSCAAL